MLILHRYKSDTEVTLGMLWQEDLYLADTLELPWVDNAPYISCIPEGEYNIRWFGDGHKVGPCYQLEGVSGREGILIHAANNVDELQGCIAVGTKCMEGIWHSKSTLNYIHDVIGDMERLKVVSKFNV